MFGSLKTSVLQQRWIPVFGSLKTSVLQQRCPKVKAAAVRPGPLFKCRLLILFLGGGGGRGFPFLPSSPATAISKPGSEVEDTVLKLSHILESPRESPKQLAGPHPQGILTYLVQGAARTWGFFKVPQVILMCHKLENTVLKPKSRTEGKKKEKWKKLCCWSD